MDAAQVAQSDSRRPMNDSTCSICSDTNNFRMSLLQKDMNPRRRALIVFWAGLLLLLASVLLPGMVPYRHTYAYEAEPVRYDGPAQEPPFDSSLILLQDCRIGYAAECIWARRVGGNGSVRINTTGTLDGGSELHAYDEYLVLQEKYVRVEPSVRGDILIIRFHPIPARWIYQNASITYESAPPLAREAISNGKATATYRTWGPDIDHPEFVDNPNRVRYVQRGETVYRLRLVPLGRRPLLPRWVYGLGRVGGFLGGLALVYVGRGRHARLTASE